MWIARYSTEMWIVSERDTFEVLTTSERALSLFATRSSPHGLFPSLLPAALGQNWYVTSKAVIPRHASVGNSTSRIWGTDKRSKLGVSFCTKRFRKAIPLSPLDLTNGVPLATVCIAARLHPRFKAHTARSHSSGRSRTLPAYDRPPIVSDGEMRRNETSNDDLLRTTSAKRRFVTRVVALHPGESQQKLSDAEACPKWHAQKNRGGMSSLVRCEGEHSKPK